MLAVSKMSFDNEALVKGGASDKHDTSVKHAAIVGYGALKDVDKSNAFSLIELLISLIIISLIAASFAPVMTKKLKHGNVAIGIGSSTKISSDCEASFGADCKLCETGSQKCLLCTKTCPEGQFQHTESCSCKSCSEFSTGCTTCTNKICTKCQIGYGISGGKCVKCASNQLSDGVTCSSCPSNSVCENGQAISCPVKYYCENGYKYPCPDGFICVGGKKRECNHGAFCKGGLEVRCRIFGECGTCTAEGCLAEGCQDGYFEKIQILNRRTGASNGLTDEMYDIPNGFYNMCISCRYTDDDYVCKNGTKTACSDLWGEGCRQCSFEKCLNCDTSDWRNNYVLINGRCISDIASVCSKEGYFVLYDSFGYYQGCYTFFENTISYSDIRREPCKITCSSTNGCFESKYWIGDTIADHNGEILDEIKADRSGKIFFYTQGVSYSAQQKDAFYKNGVELDVSNLFSTKATIYTACEVINNPFYEL